MGVVVAGGHLPTIADHHGWRGWLQLAIWFGEKPVLAVCEASPRV